MTIPLYLAIPMIPLSLVGLFFTSLLLMQAGTIAYAIYLRRKSDA